MVRFSRLKGDTQDQINAFLARIANTFSIAEQDLASIIPEDIRPRKEDGKTDDPENDARNWGLTFIKLVTTIAVRHVEGDLDKFQSDLRDLVWEEDRAEHPYCTLEDIRQLKAWYEGRDDEYERLQEGDEEVEGNDVEDERYAEEELLTQLKRGRETEISKPQKTTRLRRGSCGYYRPEKKPKKSQGRSSKEKAILTPKRLPSIVSSSFAEEEEEEEEGEQAKDNDRTSEQSKGNDLQLELLKAELELAEAQAKVSRAKRDRFYAQASARSRSFT